MFERPHTFDAYFLPGPAEGLDLDTGLRLGLRWLLDQPGRPLIVLNKKSMVSNNRLLATTAKAAAIPVVALPQLYDHSWSGGAVLAPWVNEKTLLGIDEDLHAATAVCVIGHSTGSHSAWLTGHGARDLRSPGTEPARPQLDPVVRVAMQEAGRMINHGNALVTADDKAYVVRTLQELVRSGHRYDVDSLVGWAMSAGWDAGEIPQLREYATRVLDKRTFRLGDAWGPQKGAAKEWERLAAEQGAHGGGDG